MIPAGLVTLGVTVPPGNHADPTRNTTMTRFLAGVLVCAAAYTIGWPRIEAALETAQKATQAAYHAAVAATDGGAQ